MSLRTWAMGYMLESNNEWYAEQAKLLVAHIDKLNANAQDAMAIDPDLWIGMLTNDIFHWAEYGVHTVADLENYLDAEAERNSSRKYFY